jgi:hypothetical protein
MRCKELEWLAQRWHAARSLREYWRIQIQEHLEACEICAQREARRRRMLERMKRKVIERRRMY